MAPPSRSRKVHAAGTPRLFAPDELRLEATGLARLRDLAARRFTPTERERRRDQDRETIQKLEAWGAELAAQFRLRYGRVEAEAEGVTEHYGVCYDDGLIRIRLRHATSGRMLKESSLVDTLCHELAHLRYMDHSHRFRRLYQRILDEARRRGWYRPGPVETGRPRQGLLFGDEGCGTRRRA